MRRYGVHLKRRLIQVVPYLLESFEGSFLQNSRPATPRSSILAQNIKWHFCQAPVVPGWYPQSPKLRIKEVKVVCSTTESGATQLIVAWLTKQVLSIQKDSTANPQSPGSSSRLQPYRAPSRQK